VAQDRGWFTDYEEREFWVYKQHWTVEKALLKVHGIGTVDLPVRLDPEDPTEIGTFRLLNVLHIPDAVVNVVCASKLGGVYIHWPPVDVGEPEVKVSVGKRVAYFRHNLEFLPTLPQHKIEGKAIAGTEALPDAYLALADAPPDGYTMGFPSIAIMVDAPASKGGRHAEVPSINLRWVNWDGIYRTKEEAIQLMQNTETQNDQTHNDQTSSST
jgi:hypothetical protein